MLLILFWRTMVDTSISLLEPRNKRLGKHFLHHRKRSVAKTCHEYFMQGVAHRSNEDIRFRIKKIINLSSDNRPLHRILTCGILKAMRCMNISKNTFCYYQSRPIFCSFNKTVILSSSLLFFYISLYRTWFFSLEGI